MGIINKKSKIAIGIISFLYIIFILRVYFLYSFYTNDELYGDGNSNTNKYDNEFMLTLMFATGITLFLILLFIIMFRTRK